MVESFFKDENVMLAKITSITLSCYLKHISGHNAAKVIHVVVLYGCAEERYLGKTILSVAYTA